MLYVVITQTLSNNNDKLYSFKAESINIDLALLRLKQHLTDMKSITTTTHTQG